MDKYFVKSKRNFLKNRHCDGFRIFQKTAEIAVFHKKTVVFNISRLCPKDVENSKNTNNIHRVFHIPMRFLSLSSFAFYNFYILPR